MSAFFWATWSFVSSTLQRFWRSSVVNSGEFWVGVRKQGHWERQMHRKRNLLEFLVLQPVGQQPCDNMQGPLGFFPQWTCCTSLRWSTETGGTEKALRAECEKLEMEKTFSWLPLTYFFCYCFFCKLKTYTYSVESLPSSLLSSQVLQLVNGFRFKQFLELNKSLAF